MISKILNEEYIKIEIEKIQNRIELYTKLYEHTAVKSLTLKRLLDLKTEELRLLRTIS